MLFYHYYQKSKFAYQKLKVFFYWAIYWAQNKNMFGVGKKNSPGRRANPPTGEMIYFRVPKLLKVVNLVIPLRDYRPPNLGGEVGGVEILLAILFCAGEDGVLPPSARRLLDIKFLVVGCCCLHNLSPIPLGFILAGSPLLW